MENSLINFLLVAFVVFIAAATSSSSFTEARYEPRLVGGARYLNVDGSLLRYYIFAEERAVVSPTPEFVIWDTQTEAVAPLSPPLLLNAVANPSNLTVNGTNKTRTPSRSESHTIDELATSRLSWHIRSKPFGALGIQGPRYWEGTGQTQNRFLLTDWIFQTAGEYNMGFNVSFYDGTHFVFNRTITVNRQPAFLANGPLPFGNNGSAWSPAPVATVQNVLGVIIPTDSVNVTFEFQAFPSGATWSGTLNKFTDATGTVRFDDIIVSIPGAYTYRMTATLSDGSTLAANSVQINVERALPIRIEKLSSLDGISSFHILELPTFVIYDTVGLAYDTSLNMTLSLASTTPSFSYDGFESIATLNGVLSRRQNLDGYTFTFPGVSIDLPGPYEVAAAIALPDGSTLVRGYIANIEPAPTFEFPNGRDTLQRNKISTMTIYGRRPPFDEILLMLGDDENCTNQASDMIVWTAESVNVSLAQARNFSVVPWVAGTLFPCMKIPPQPLFGVLVQNYLPQFDEQYPYIVSVPVADVDECKTVTALEALQYESGGWDTVQSDRQYGCALPLPSSGTIAPCKCASYLTCSAISHPVFTPPGLNIGTCQCCAAWIMALAAAVILGVFGGLLYVVYHFV